MCLYFKVTKSNVFVVFLSAKICSIGNIVALTPWFSWILKLISNILGNASTHSLSKSWIFDPTVPVLLFAEYEATAAWLSLS